MAQFQAGFQPLVIFEGSGVQFLRDNLERQEFLRVKQNEPVQKVGYQILCTNKNAPA